MAPIIIRDCREEFQHVTEFKEPIVFGSIADNMPEHPLIKVNIIQHIVRTSDFLKSRQSADLTT